MVSVAFSNFVSCIFSEEGTKLSGFLFLVSGIVGGPTCPVHVLLMPFVHLIFI